VGRSRSPVLAAAGPWAIDGIGQGRPVCADPEPPVVLHVVIRPKIDVFLDERPVLSISLNGFVRAESKGGQGGEANETPTQ
jgi:hypothetical protein